MRFLSSSRAVRCALTISLAFCTTARAFAEETYFSCFLKGTKIGWQSLSTRSEMRKGVVYERSDSKTQMNLGLIGTPLEVKIVSSTLTLAGRPVEMDFRQDSSDRFQKLKAIFDEKTVKCTIDNNGTVTTQTLEIPNGGKIVDDPLIEITAGKIKKGVSVDFWLLDSTTVSFIKNKVTYLGEKLTKINGQEVKAMEVEISDPRMKSSVFLDEKGKIIKVSSGIGIELYPSTREEALAVSTSKAPDLGDLTSIRPNKILRGPERLTMLEVNLVSPDLEKLPSDTFQTASPVGNGWRVKIHPRNLGTTKFVTIAKAKAQQPNWIKPTLNMPANAPKFKALARQIIGDSKSVLDASKKIRAWVFKVMTPNAGIGVLRDATEVLKAKEGVCRDYAILAGTISRAAGIPTRLVSGLVSWDGVFYYHAWIEVWSGSEWIGFDPSGPSDQISAAHIKFAQGNVDSAFTFTVLPGAKLEVLNSKTN